MLLACSSENSILHFSILKSIYTKEKNCLFICYTLVIDPLTGLTLNSYRYLTRTFKHFFQPGVINFLILNSNYHIIFILFFYRKIYLNRTVYNFFRSVVIKIYNANFLYIVNIINYILAAEIFITTLADTSLRLKRLFPQIKNFTPKRILRIPDNTGQQC